ncbi:hypothetical protein [Bowmanella yangjiangensis]|uniref:Uncharacterized protein n=1 Tax=Bowmanella yangjiangensis TaxID=2811230 RepID=A0ABS3CXZ3_9ALTE|nr:hypothetical protein [Bowmanella yangjiangensis]MBN7820509.1 hypothetical protein [Bowmanella yangjiangensis]
MNKWLIGSVFLILGFILGYWYQDSSSTYHAEELIGKEVALLESSKAIDRIAFDIHT